MNLTEMYKNYTEICEQKYEESKSNEISGGLFPWIAGFNKMLCSSAGSKNYHILQRLLSIYIRNISTSMDAHCTEIPNIIKLKCHISNTLMFFHFYWLNIREHISDHSSYFNKISVLLSIYIDMELKTHNHNKESSKMTVKFLSILYIYLTNSEEHILGVLLRTKLCTKKYSKIYDSIFTKVLTKLKENRESITDMQYVRYLLMFKLWKRINYGRENTNEQQKIDKIAVMILGPHIPKMRDDLLKIIPKPPAEHGNGTLWLLQPNIFDLKEARDRFLALEGMQYNVMQCGTSRVKNFPDFNTHEKLQISVRDTYSHQGCSVSSEEGDERNNYCFESTLDNFKLRKPITNANSIKKSRKLKKYKPKPNLKPGEIVFVDLTKEDEIIEASECKNVKRKTKRTLEWLKIIKERFRKQVTTVTYKNKVEIADAHSTENFESSVDQYLLKYMPISDDKVTESSESCAQLEESRRQSNKRYIIPLRIRKDSKENKDLKCTVQYRQCNICNLILKHGEIQHNRGLCLLELLSFITQNIKDPKAILSLINDCKQTNITRSRISAAQDSTPNACCNKNDQNKEDSFLQERNVIDTLIKILLPKECQNNTVEIQNIKQELPTSTDNSITVTDNNCSDVPISIHDTSRLSGCRAANKHCLQVVEGINQKILPNDCSNCCTRTEIYNSILPNNGTLFNRVKIEDTALNVSTESTEKKSTCDKNIIGMLSDLDKCVDVLNRIAEHIMSVHAEKQQTKFSDKTDMCVVSTTVFGDQNVESPVDSITRSISSLTNSEKINRVLALHKQEEIASMCSFKDVIKSNDHETDDMVKEIKQESEVEKCQISLENRYSQFAYPHIKSELPNAKDNINFIRNSITKPDHPRTENTHTNIVADIKDHITECSDLDSECTQPTSNQNTFHQLRETYSEFEKVETNTERSNMDEFENIDILDSILNGDMTMQADHEILEDSQPSMMSPISYDNSANVLNCITEFFSQSEHTYASKHTTCTEIPSKSLPEGSLGTTGILNTLLDFDLTNMDVPLNDFTYSNIQTVNPRLIRKGVDAEIFSTTSNDISELNPEILSIDKTDVEKTFPSTESESNNYQNDSIDSSVDPTVFGLSSTLRNISTSPCERSTASGANIAGSESRESLSKYMHSNSVNAVNVEVCVDSSYNCEKDEDVQQTQATNSRANYFSVEVYPAVNMSSLLSQNDQENHADNAVFKQVKISPPVRKQASLCNPAVFVDSNACASAPISDHEHIEEILLESLEQQNVHEHLEYTRREKQNRTVKRRAEFNVPYRMARKKLKHELKNKEDNVHNEHGNERQEVLFVQPSPDNLSMRYSQLTCSPLKYEDASDTPEVMGSSLYHSVYPQNSLHTVRSSKNTYKKLKCVGLQQLRNISQRKQKILLNIRDKAGTDLVLKTDSEDKNILAKDNANETSRVTCRSKEKSNVSCTRNRTSLVFSKKNIRTDIDVSSVNHAKNKRVTELSSNNVLNKPGKKWTVQSVDVQSSKCIKKHVISTNLAFDNEDSALKKRNDPLNSSPQPGTVGSITQQAPREKRLVSLKTVNCNGIEDDLVVPSKDQDGVNRIRHFERTDV